MGVFLADAEFVFLDAGDRDLRTRRRDAQLLAELRTDHDGVVPRDLRDRIGALLQPAVVVEPAIIHLVVGHKTDFEILGGERLYLRRRRGEEGPGTTEVELRGRLRIGRTREKAVVQETTHGLFHIATGETRNGLADKRVAVTRLSGDASDDFNLRNSAEKRQNHRLHRHHRAIRGAGVTPGLKVVRRREIRARQRGGLVGRIAEANHLTDRCLQRRPIKVGRRVVRRIAAKNNECLDRTGLNRRRDIGNRSSRRGLNRDKIHRLADIAEERIDRVGDRVDLRREVRAGHYETLAFVGAEIVSAFIDPLLADKRFEPFRQRLEYIGAINRLKPDSRREREHVAGGEAEAMIRHAACEGECAFRHVEAVHVVVCGASLPAARGSATRIDRLGKRGLHLANWRRSCQHWQAGR